MNRQINLWDRIENSHIDPNAYRNLVNKIMGAKMNF